MTYKKFEGSADFGGAIENGSMMGWLDSSELFTLYNCAEWIQAFRTPARGPIDIDATAAKVGVPVFREMPIIDGAEVIAQACIMGVGKGYRKEPISIHLDSYNPPDSLAAIFGHELGHLFLETAASVPQTEERPDIEAFCDFVGDQVALPMAELGDIAEANPADVIRLMQHYKLDLMPVLRQLMRCHALPNKFIMDTSSGETPNPLYSNKVSRCIICLDCTVGRDHDTYTDLANTPFYDFTAYPLAYEINFSPCDRAGTRSNRDAHIELNKQYGLWSAEDEAYLHAAKEEW